MSSNVKNPFYNRNFAPKDAFIADIKAGVTGVRDIVGAFKEKITPEEQQRKAGVWWNMLQNFVSVPSKTGAELVAEWQARFPFKQKRTRQAFGNKLRVQKREQVINTLVGKINDELVKGGLPSMTKDQILQNMGVKKVPQTIEQVMSGRKPIPTRPTPVVKLPLPDKKIGKIDPRYDVVRPLRNTMEMALKTKGVNPSDNIEVLTNQFYNEIVRSDQPNNFSGQVELPPVYLYGYTKDNADEATDAVITAVVSYIKGLKKRQEQGQELSQVQDIIVRGTERAEGIAKQAAKDEAAQRVGSQILFGGKWLYIIGGFIALIILVVALRRK